MLKTKQKRFAIVAVLLFSMITMYGGIPAVNAGSHDSTKLTLSDSDLGAVATSTIEVDLATMLTASEYVQVTFPAGFTGVSSLNVDCPTNSTAGGSGQSITCTVDAGESMPATSTQTITISDITNPGTAGDYTITVNSYTSGSSLIDQAEVKVYIIDDVLVTARVAASLSFAVQGVATTTTVNGDATTGSTSPTRIDFGTLDTLSQYIMGQGLAVSTNASGGFSVTVQQDQNMTSAGSADIDAFNTATATDWVSPTAVLGDENTYGYMGVATDDGDLLWGEGRYQGLDGTTPLEIFSHTGPADGSVQGIGTTTVAYSIEITDLQEAGDYQNTLTYVCTPTF
ncbi:hypothetical protein C0583_05125 [Candidatus Parcubacteria bacterium]|nr:MAG: hypothetical protein C0583_05125 [Candidatus Parcubacteria bacterium]